jgi:ADP-ribose pyrophosphatase YjhB (NUDIX family)
MEPKVIFAAGGILWKKISGEYKICLVYRERYGGKWSLPKGKLKENESWETAAVREVNEETGAKVQILKYANTIQYLVNSSTKIVMFWHMKETGRTSNTIDSEVVKTGWFTVKEAISKIDYEEEIKILRGIEFPGGGFKESLKNILRVFNPRVFINKYFNRGTRFQRLEGDIKEYIEYLEYRIGRNKSDKLPEWAEHARKLVKNSVDELLAGNVDMAWKSLNSAKRIQLFGFSDEELIEKAKVIRFESAKLNEWRRKAVYKLVGDNENPRDDISADSLYMASQLRDEHYNNGYHKYQLIKDVYRILLVSMVLTIIAIWIYFRYIDINNLLQSNDNSLFYVGSLTTLALGIILFGILGGCISSIFHIRDSSNIARIPVLLNNNYVTFIRIFIGGGLAFIIFVFIQSDFTEKIFQFELRPTNPFTYFAISFVAGFSERLVLKAITSIAGKET